MTIDQLKTRTWPTEAMALKALKAAGMPAKGEDYELRRVLRSWQIVETNAPAAPKPAKPAHPADVRDIAKIAGAASFSIHFRVSPTKTVNRTAASLAEARDIRDELNREHGKNGRRAGIYAIPADGGASVIVPDSYAPPPEASGVAEAIRILGGPLPEEPPVTMLPERPARGITKSPQKKAADAATRKAANGAATPMKAAPEADGPKNDLSILPAEGGPYRLVIAWGQGKLLLDGAMLISRKYKAPVAIVGPDGAIVRTIDGNLGGRVTREPRAPRAPRTNGAGPSGKAGRMAELLKRPEGATMAQLREITVWAPGMRTLNDIATRAGGTLKTIAKHHWRIELTTAA